MVQLKLENLIPPFKGEHPLPLVEFTNLGGLSPAEQWFYHWVHNMVLAAPYPDLEPVRCALLTHLPQRTKRYSRNIPDPNTGESWLRSVLITGELLKLQPKSDRPPLIVAVHPSTSSWKQGFEKISTLEFSAARHALGINKHWMLVLEGIADVAPSLDELMNALKKQADDPAECAVIHLS